MARKKWAGSETMENENMLPSNATGYVDQIRRQMNFWKWISNMFATRLRACGYPIKRSTSQQQQEATKSTINETKMYKDNVWKWNENMLPSNATGYHIDNTTV